LKDSWPSSRTSRPPSPVKSKASAASKRG
jgi:hypothetical protein